MGVVWSWSWQMGPGTSQLPRLPIMTEMAELLAGQVFWEVLPEAQSTSAHQSFQ